MSADMEDSANPSDGGAVTLREADPRQGGIVVAGRNGDYDVEVLRRMYVEGEPRHDKVWGSYTHYPSQKEIARATGASLAMIAVYASEGDWVLARADFQAKADEKRQDLRAKAMAKHALKMDSDAVKASTIGLAMVLARVEEIAETHHKRLLKRQQIAEGMLAAELDDQFEAAIDGRELETLARAGRAWHDLGRKVLGYEDEVHIKISGGVEVRNSINGELLRDDPDRLYGFFVAAERSGLLADNILEGELAGEGEVYEQIEAGQNLIPAVSPFDDDPA